MQRAQEQERHEHELELQRAHRMQLLYLVAGAVLGGIVELVVRALAGS